MLFSLEAHKMQKNAGFQKEIMSVSCKDGFVLYFKSFWTLGINKISDHIYKQRKNHRIYLGGNKNPIQFHFPFLK